MIALLFYFLNRGGVEEAADKVGVNVNLEAPEISVPDNIKVDIPEEVKIDTGGGNSAQ